VITRRQQFVVSSAFDDPPARQDGDPIHSANSREAMSDDDRRAACLELFQRFEKLRFGPGVEGAGRFIHDQHRCILQKRAGDGNPLPLASRQTHAAFTELCVIAQRQFRDELVSTRSLGRRLNLLEPGATEAICDVFGNRRAKEHRLRCVAAAKRG